jgi:hypothetical protein
MTKVAVALLGVAAAWLFLLVVLLPIYVEPGMGSLRCARVWQQEPSDSEIRDMCDRAINHRREALRAPMLVASSGGVLLAVAMVRARRRDADANA